MGVRDAKPSEGTLRYAWRLVLMFHLTCLGWLLFRADSFEVVVRALSLMLGHFHPTSHALTPLLVVVFYSAGLLALEHWLEGEERLDKIMRAPAVLQGLCYVYFVAMLVIFHAERAFEFIYFQF